MRRSRVASKAGLKPAAVRMIDQNTEIGVNRRLSADELELPTAERASFVHRAKPISELHLLDERQMWARVGVAVPASEVALPGYLEPEEPEARQTTGSHTHSFECLFDQAGLPADVP